MNCFCSKEALKYTVNPLLFTDQDKDDKTDYCEIWRNNFRNRTLVTSLSALLIALLNGLFSLTFKKLAALEGHDLKNEQSSAQFTYVFATKYINVTLLILFANFNYQGYGVVGDLTKSIEDSLKSLNISIFTGVHDGFYTAWFFTVGCSISFTLLLMNVTSYFITYLEYLLVYAVPRAWDRSASMFSICCIKPNYVKN